MLVPLLRTVKSVDVFVHDSEHSYQNMMWEFKTVWGLLNNGGILISDDITCNRAFSDFCKIVRPTYIMTYWARYRVGTYNVIGIIRK